MNDGILDTEVWKATWKEQSNESARSCLFASCTHCAEQASQIALLNPDYFQKKKKKGCFKSKEMVEELKFLEGSNC